MYARLGLGVIWPIYMYIDQYRGLRSKTERIYIYIYIYIHTLESWRARVNLARIAQYGYRKLWYMTFSFHIC